MIEIYFSQKKHNLENKYKPYQLCGNMQKTKNMQLAYGKEKKKKKNDGDDINKRNPINTY